VAIVDDIGERRWSGGSRRPDEQGDDDPADKP
jgi:hypothetical protein